MMSQEKQFVIKEDAVPGLSGLKVGQRFNAIFSYETVEKTKSYTMLKIKYIQINQPKRKY